MPCLSHLYYLCVLVEVEMLSKYSFQSLSSLVNSCKSTLLFSLDLPHHLFFLFSFFFHLYFRKKSPDQKTSTTKRSRCCSAEEEVDTHEPRSHGTEDSHSRCCFSAAVPGQGNSLTGTEELQETGVTCSLAKRWSEPKRQEFAWNYPSAGEIMQFCVSFLSLLLFF